MGWLIGTLIIVVLIALGIAIAVCIWKKRNGHYGNVPNMVSSSSPSSPNGFATFICDKNMKTWTCLHDYSAPGFVAEPPTRLGAYPEECVRVNSVRKPEGA